MIDDPYKLITELSAKGRGFQLGIPLQKGPGQKGPWLAYVLMGTTPVKGSGKTAFAALLDLAELLNTKPKPTKADDNDHGDTTD